MLAGLISATAFSGKDDEVASESAQCTIAEAGLTLLPLP
jgi:hypothetical protein